MTSKTIEERFWAKVRKTDTCWWWTGMKITGGYGGITLNRKQILAHRLSWMLHNGDIPKGKQINHICNNPACVNPSHLYAGTHADNMRDKVVSGHSKNPGIGRPSLTAGERAIRITVTVTKEQLDWLDSQFTPNRSTAVQRLISAAQIVGFNSDIV